MASSPPQIRASFQSYRDEALPSSGSRPDSRADLESYFNANPPPPHRLSGFYPSATGSAASSTDALPHMREARGSYLSPAAANSATTTVGIGLQQQARNSEVSMIGLGQTVPVRKSTWLEKETKNQNRGRKLFITTCSILVLLIIAGIVLGVVFGTRAARNNSDAEGDSDSKNNSTGNTSTAGVVEQEDPNDPSTFEKDPRLKNSFYGIAYTQMDSLYPDCNQGLAATIEDIQLMSQLTNRIRLYGGDCNQTALVLEAIKQTKVDMKIFAAIYLLPDDEPSYQRQRTAVRQALEDYGSDNIEGITVGNEFMLNYILENGGDSAESAIGLEASALLREKIQDVRDMLTGMDIDLPVGTSDAGAYFNTDLLEAVDFGLSNIHAWFASTSVETSAQWTFDFFETENVEPASLLSNRPTMYIAETGWPTHSSDAEHENNGASDASVANLQTFMDDFVCQANRDNVNYFFFEYSDVPWKDTRFGGVEGFWGLFDENKQLKDITIPDCAHR